MLGAMRTTVRLEEGLLREAKRFAAEHGRTLTSLLDQGLREVLSRRHTTRRRRRVRLPTFRGRGLQPGVDLDSTASLLDLMEGRGAAR